MNIIILSKNYEKYKSSYYHHDIVKEFMKKANCYLYGKGYPHYDIFDNIEDVIIKSPFNKKEIDIIVVSTSWEIQDETIEESDPQPRINLGKLVIPKVFFLNKEYKKLEKKLEYAKKNEFDLICTVHQDYEKWAKKTGLHFIRLPFAADPIRFKDYGFQKKYDFGFTGNLHKKYTDIRYRIKCLLFNNPDAKSLGLSVFLRINPFKIAFSIGKLKEEYKNFKIYWAEWGARDLLMRSLLPTGIKYTKFLNSFKSFLSTPSALGIINTRFFECMAVKTLLFCPESEYYDGMFKDRYNCVMFKEDLSNFNEILHHILSNDVKRNRIIENAYNDFINNHTYEKRIETVLACLGFQ